KFFIFRILVILTESYRCGRRFLTDTSATPSYLVSYPPRRVSVEAGIRRCAMRRTEARKVSLPARMAKENKDVLGRFPPVSRFLHHRRDGRRNRFFRPGRTQLP